MTLEYKPELPSGWKRGKEIKLAHVGRCVGIVGDQGAVAQRMHTASETPALS